MLRNFTKMAALPLLALCAAAPAQNTTLPSPPPTQAPAPWPISKPGRVLSTPDWSDYRLYPLAARRKDAEGATVSEIRIAADGKPIECRIVQGSGSVELDNGTCDLMMTMRFEPARDAHGAPTQSSFRRRVVWLLTEERPFASSSVEVRMDRQADGSWGCMIRRAEGAYSAAWSAIACNFLGDTGYYFKASADGARHFIIAARLDAGDQSDFLSHPWPEGKMVAQEKVAFEINAQGDPSDCKAEPQWGFGTRSLNNLSPCGRLLSMLWIKNAFQKHGLMETRVYMLGDGQ